MPTDTEPTYRVLLESMVDGVFVALHQRFVFANSAFPAMLGYDHDTFIGLPFESVIAPEFLDLWNTRYRERVGNGVEPPNHYELRLLKRGGVDSVWVELRASRLVFEGERSVLGIVRDMTERRRAAQALHDSEAQYRFLIDHLPAAVVVHAPDGSVILANARAMRLLGAADNGPCGTADVRSAWRLCGAGGAPLPPDQLPLQRVLETHTPVIEQLIGVERAPGVPRRWLLVDAFPEIDAHDSLRQIIVTYSDITALKLAESLAER